MAALVAAGELIFGLPFVVARVFRPTLLDVFGLTNLELGAAFSIYGIVAMASYYVGGPLADRFSARRLMATALLATSLGGAVFAQIPSIGVLTALYAFWGLTTILLFWAPLMRATREWGGEAAIGRAYGILDGGRGLAAATVASVSVAVLALALPGDVTTATLGERSVALSNVIWGFTALTALSGVFVWFAVPDNDPRQEAGHGRSAWADARRVLGMPAVWLQAVVIVCAYVGYKATDDFSLFARDAFGYDDVAAARVGTISFWMRPFAAVCAGFLADKLTPSRVTAASFALVIAGCLAMTQQPGIHWILLTTVAATSVGVYAVRGVYYALFGESQTPMAVTGSAVGLVSLIGYTPDVFMGPLMGHLLDRSPGIAGHEHVFLVVAAFGALGLAATLLFSRVAKASPSRQGSSLA